MVRTAAASPTVSPVTSIAQCSWSANSRAETASCNRWAVRRSSRPVALYLLGGVLLGSAVIRAHVLSRGAGTLLLVGAACSLLVPLVPHAVGRYAAVPYGAALIWLGYSLWTDRQATSTAVPSASGTAERTSAAIG